MVALWSGKAANLAGVRVCSGNPFVLRAKSEGENPAYFVLGQTDGGRYLFCVVILFREAKGYSVTARNMTAQEKRRFQQWKSR